MNFFRDVSIRHKMLIVIMMTTGAALLLACTALVTMDILFYRRAMANTITALADVLGANCTAALAFEDSHAAQDVLSALKADPRIVGACLYDRSGIVFADHNCPAGIHVFDPPNKMAFSGAKISSDFVDVVRPVELDGELLGVLFVRANLQIIEERYREYFIIIAAIIGVVSLISLLISINLQKLVSDPILRLAATTRRLTEKKDYSVRETKQSDDEIGGLIDGFNEMLSEIQRRDADLQKAHDELEKRVEERTRDLQEEIAERQRIQQRERELQALLARSERMESLGLMAGGVAHDLNNILGPIVGYPDLILEQLPEGDPIRSDVEQIKLSSKRAADIIQDMLTMARRGSYQPEPVNVNDVVTMCLQSASFRDVQTRNPHVKIEIHLEPGLLPISASTPHLSRALLNLVINAFEAMPNGGTVAVSTSMQYLEEPLSGYDTIKQGDYAVLKISDTGVGIKPIDLQRIFEPFYTTKKMGRSGSGLGLAVVYGVVKDIHGYIDIKTELNKGTEFILYLPVTRDVAETVQEQSGDYHGSETILVVDDEESQRNVAKRLLASLGYRVCAVDNGHAAIDFLRKNSVNLVILDMIMEEGFDGLDTYKGILKINPKQHCIIASGFSETDRIREAQALGAGTYVRKPYTREKIGKAVRQELSKDTTVG